MLEARAVGWGEHGEETGERRRGVAIETDPRRERNRIAERVIDGEMERRGQ